MFYDFYDNERSEATTATDGDTRLAAAPSRWLACAILVNIHFSWGLDFVVLFALASPALVFIFRRRKLRNRFWDWNGMEGKQINKKTESPKKIQAANPTSRGRILLYTPGSWVIDGRVENQSVVAFDRTSSQSDNQTRLFHVKQCLRSLIVYFFPLRMPLLRDALLRLVAPATGLGSVHDANANNAV